MSLRNHRVVRKILQAGAAGAAASLTAVALYTAYAVFGVPSLREVLVASVGGFVVLVAAVAAWEHWNASDVLKLEFKGAITRRAAPFDDKLGADGIVDDIEDVADEDGTEALLLEVSSPGGEVVPSADIYHAIDEFDGPSVAVVEDVCASGAYLAAAACDRIVAREDSTVGSIGVIASQVNASELAEEVGIDYEGFTAGEYKDAGHPLKEPSEQEREYIQGLIDGHYDRFVSRVAEQRGLDEAAVRDLEARVFDGPGAIERGLVDEIGDEDDAKAYLLDELEHAPVEVDDLRVQESRSSAPSPFSPAAAVERAAYAFGRGLGASIEASVETLLSGRRFR